MSASLASCRSSRMLGLISTLSTRAFKCGVAMRALSTHCIVNAVLPCPGAPPMSVPEFPSLERPQARTPGKGVGVLIF